jgi:transcription-repair coupling factor (superfamily II helicase)
MADAHRWTQDLKLFGTPALEFASPEPRLWRGGHHREADAERAMIARRLTVAEPITVVATPAALGAPLLSRAEFADRTLRVAPGDRLDRELLLEALERCGYERVDTVVAVGQWSLRGGIVDVFSPSQSSPARLEFFGDDVESIRRSIPHRSARSRRSTSCWCSRSFPRKASPRATRGCWTICRGGAGHRRCAEVARRTERGGAGGAAAP